MCRSHVVRALAPIPSVIHRHLIERCCTFGRLDDGWGRNRVKDRRVLNSITASPPPDGDELQRIGSCTVVFVGSADEAIALREDLGEAMGH